MAPIDYDDQSQPQRIPPHKLHQAIHTYEFPANRDALMKEAKDKGAPDTVVTALQSLPEGRYTNPDEAVKAYDDATITRG